MRDKLNAMTPERDPRIYFAAERTMLAWVRTGLAMMGFGFVVARFGLFMRELAMARGAVTQQAGGSLWAGMAPVLLGVIVNLFAAASHRCFTARYEQGDVQPEASSFGTAIATILSGIGVAMAIYLVIQELTANRNSQTRREARGSTAVCAVSLSRRLEQTTSHSSKTLSSQMVQ